MRGSCLCHAVTFEFDGAIESLQACHCSRCRKFYGGAFGPIAIVRRVNFSYLSGEDFIASYPSSERVNRYFCRVCSSPLPLVEDWDPLVGIPLGGSLVRAVKRCADPRGMATKRGHERAVPNAQ
jgi:hypothetical protein